MTLTRRVLLLVSCVFAVGLSGCVLMRGYYDRPIDQRKLEAIEPGVTTKQQVLDLLGPPTSVEARDIVNVQALITESTVNRLTASRYFRYSYGRANGALFTIVLFTYADVDVKFDTAMIFFDDKDVVEYVSYADDTQYMPSFGPLSR